MKAFDQDNDESGSPTVAVGSCVARSGDGTLAVADCASEGAQVITQIAPAGTLCDRPQDIQHLFRAAGRSSICVRAAG